MLARFVDVGVDIFAMLATLSLAARRSSDLEDPGPQQLADLFCRLARSRVDANLATVGHDPSHAVEAVTQAVMAGKHDWLYEGVMPDRALG